MTITVECPHCESQFHLSPDLAGKAVPCPVCRTPFVVEAAAPAPRPVPIREPATAELPYERIEAERYDAPAQESRPRVAPPAAPLMPPAKPKPPAAKPLPPAKPLPGPREVAWDGQAPPAADSPRPAPRPAPPVVPLEMELGPDEVDNDDPILRRRRRRGWPKPLLFSLIAAVFLLGVGIAVGLMRSNSLREERGRQFADLAFADGKFDEAKKGYEQLVGDFPESAEVERYRFFADLSDLRVSLGSLTLKENPKPGEERFAAFVTAHGDDPLARPDSGHGSDVVQAGKQLAEAFADAADMRLTAFRSDRTKLDELGLSEVRVTEGEALLLAIEKFRGKEGIPLTSVRQRFAELTERARGERHRLAVLLPFRNLSDDPTARRIEAFEAALAQDKLGDDAEAKGMVAAAEKRLRELIGHAAGGVPARTAPPPRDRLVLFSAGTEAKAAPDAAAEVAFALDRGTLYALDPATGALLWGVALTKPTADRRSYDLPVPTGADGGDGQAAVLLTGDADGVPNLTARVARTGEALWYQPLEAPPVGRPLVVGRRVYVPLADERGTVAEFDTLSGTRLGELRIRQPIGSDLAVMPGAKPTSQFLFVPAEDKRVVVFELGREDETGERLPPACVQVLFTDHPRGSLRGEPVLVAPASEAGPRYLILTQTSGPPTTKLRAFPLPRPEEFAKPGEPPTQVRPTASEVSVPGWPWFPATCDGERYVMATDAGTFLALGVNQVGNADQALFLYPGPRPGGEQKEVSQAQVVSANEDAYWVILAGQLVQLRTVLDPAGGMRIVAHGAGRPVGEPLQRPQPRLSLGLTVVLTRDPGATSPRALGLDLRTGQVRWQRALGVGATLPPIPLPGQAETRRAAVVGDPDGRLSAVAEPADAARPVTPLALAAPYPLPPAGQPRPTATATRLLASDDGSAACLCTAETDPAGQRLKLRFLLPAERNPVVRDVAVPLPDRLSGPPLLLGQSLLVPLANGVIYRVRPDDGKLSAGPLWRGDGGTAEITCFLSAAGPDEFLATDGVRRFYRWRWPAEEGAKPERLAGPWQSPEKIALAPVALDQGVLIVDAANTLTLWPKDRPGEPLRRWRGREGGPLPAGTVTQPAVTRRPGQVLVTFAVANRHLVTLDPGAAEPVWVRRDLGSETAGDLVGWAVADGRVLVADPAGQLLTLDLATGEPHPRPTPHAPLSAPPVLLTATKALGLTVNGTGVILDVPAER